MDFRLQTEAEIEGKRPNKKGHEITSRVTKESMVDKTYSSENLPTPLFAKEG